MNRSNKTRLCAEWLNWCADHGWSRSVIPQLEDVFWKCGGWKTFAGYVKPPKTEFKFAR